MRLKEKHSRQAHIGSWVPQLQHRNPNTARRPVVDHLPWWITESRGKRHQRRAQRQAHRGQHGEPAVGREALHGEALRAATFMARPSHSGQARRRPASGIRRVHRHHERIGRQGDCAHRQRDEEPPHGCRNRVSVVPEWRRDPDLPGAPGLMHPPGREHPTTEPVQAFAACRARRVGGADPAGRQRRAVGGLLLSAGDVYQVSECPDR